MKNSSRIFVAGHQGLVGSALVRCLNANGYQNLVLRTKSELNLMDQAKVHDFFKSENIDQVILAAGRVGGIRANSTHQADFLYENVLIAANLIHAAAVSGTQKLLYLASACIYPKIAPQPISESSLLTAPLEETNEGYAVAKIAGVKLCEMFHRQYQRDFVSVFPTNLYGIHDSFHPSDSHVIPGVMRRFHEAKMAGASEVVVWGTGTPMREFLYVDDLAEALLIIMRENTAGIKINVGSSQEVTIQQLAELMKGVVGFRGKIVYDRSMPDGFPRRVLDSTRIRDFGWRPSVSLAEGLERTYAWALENKIFSNE